jgi:hypothetical protein
VIERLRAPLEHMLWALLALLLPFTSLPLVAKLSGGTMVAPASLLPLILLILLVFLPYLLRGRGLPRQVIPILALVLVAVLSTSWGLMNVVPIFKDVSRLKNALSGLATLGIGLAFYLAASTWPDSPEKFRFIYRWVNVAGCLLVLWGVVQFAAWQIYQEYPAWMLSLQRYFTSNGMIYPKRVNAFAYEPSWLGHQLVMLFLPYWLSATVNRTSAFGRRLLKVSLENILLLAGIGILVVSLARSALVSFLLACTYLFFLGTLALVRWARGRILARQAETGHSRLSPRWLTFLIWVVVILAYAALLAAGLFVLTRIDTRMQNLFTLLKEQVTFDQLAHNLVFGERVAFWQTGLAVFTGHPILGVGLNSAGFYFPELLTPGSWSLVEPYKLYYSGALPNTLSLWIRLLSETGILGFACFVSWAILLWLTAARLQRSPDPVVRTVALAGSFVLVSLLMEGMSVDTFAFPYWWLSLGWLTAAFRLQAGPVAETVTAPV